MEKEKKPVKPKILAGVAIILTALANMLVLLMFWVIKRYDRVQFDQILYQIKSSISGTSNELVVSAVLEVVLVGILLAAVEIFIYLLLMGKLKKPFEKFKSYASYTKTKVALFFKKRFVTMSALTLILSMLIFILGLDVHSFVYDAIVGSTFIEDNYVNPDSVEIKFEGEKRNLIYIFVESMENTFSDPEACENYNENLIRELTELAEQNVSFKGSDGKSGAFCYIGTRWTAASMFAQTSGVIMKVPINFDKYGDGSYMPGITTLGDILKREGYNQTLLVGSDAGFAARDAYFTEHGEYEIIDIYSLIEQGRLPEDYWEWWGFEDAKLFEFAKEELTRLASEDKPFNFTTLTTDTHFPDGYECPLCPDKYENQYSNVIACSSKQIYDFINWCKAQPFYENTTIVLAGDHLTMDPQFLAEVDENYVRTAYNCIINPAFEPIKEEPREFATFDLFPTTLAAMGASIEGDRLGLGVNLFSSVETLTERYGYERLEEELEARSDFYIDTFYKEEFSK